MTAGVVRKAMVASLAVGVAFVVNSPVVFANDLLQGETTRAGQTLGRTIVNSTLGLGGLVDLAAKIGIPGHDEDFCQTLGVWGVNEGPYLVLPFAGPSNPRDLVGVGGDYAMDPFTWITFNNSTLWYGIRAGMGVVDVRAPPGRRTAGRHPSRSWRWDRRRPARRANRCRSARAPGPARA